MSISLSISICLDKSGSMQTYRDETIKGLNEQLKTILDDELLKGKIDARVSLFTFNASVKPEFIEVPSNELKEWNDYIPSGGTAMLDALGDATFDRVNGKFDVNIVILLSDGEETSSSRWKPEAIKARFAELHATGIWTVAVMFANEHYGQAMIENLGIPTGNVQVYVANKTGTVRAMKTQANSLKSFIRGVSKGMKSTNTFYRPEIDVAAEDENQDVLSIMKE